MIDFSKRIQSKTQPKKVNPVEIYDSLDRTASTGPLRPEQRRVLENWYNERRADKDLIVKLHTGAGKTLLGLLIAQSYINSNEGPAIYICPNIYLMQQACEEAQKFGIPFEIVAPGNEIPDKFSQGKTVLITYVQKVFNGLSIFGVGNDSTKVGCLILDDSHACIDSINNACTIKVEKTSPAFQTLVDIFEEELRQQGEGTYQDFNNGVSGTIIPIPFWSWSNHISRVTEVLACSLEDNNIKFAWQILKDQLINCNAYVSPSKIEICPFCLPIEKFGIFSRAKHRVLMSATTQEDTLFIKGLGLSIQAVQNPLIDKEYLWSGEKMILIPDQICEECDTDEMITRLLEMPHDFGIVVLSPSFDKAKKYQLIGATLANEPGDSSKSVYTKVDSFKKQPNNKILVLANRYDGIDLPDNACRMLIVDSVPYYDSLTDRYEMMCRPESEIVRVKTVQKIEQGLGRSVRGEKDYSVILIVGSDLIKYLRSLNNRALFSQQTQKQIEIGFEIVDMCKEETSSDVNGYALLYSTINQCLGRDEGWKEYYASKMNDIDVPMPEQHQLYDVLQKERAVYDAIRIKDYDRGCRLLQDIVNSCDDLAEKGWYMQILAKFKYFVSKSESNQIQIAAFKNNNELLKPTTGITYKKIEYPTDDTRIQRMINAVKKYKTYENLNLFVSEQLGNFTFGVEAEKFEKVIHELGLLLGFVCQRPDKEIRMGPDNLWCLGQNQYIMFECKSQVADGRTAISKHEAGQMEEHCAWFEKEYDGMSAMNVMIIPTSMLAEDAFFSHSVMIMRKKGLAELKRGISAFFQEFKGYALDGLTTNTVNDWLTTHNMNSADWLLKYLDKPINWKNKKS